MATIRDAVLLCLSSPYARKGELYKAHRNHYGKDGDVLVIQAPTWVLNDTVPQEVIDRAYAEDEASALAEYGAQFRLDVESFVSREAVDKAVVPGRLELPPVRGEHYVGFLDFAGGSGTDSATLAVAHEEERDGLKVFTLDAVREVRPPFSPEQVCADFAIVLRSYGIGTATADRWAGAIPRRADGQVRRNRQAEREGKVRNLQRVPAVAQQRQRRAAGRTAIALPDRLP